MVRQREQPSLAPCRTIFAIPEAGIGRLKLALRFDAPLFTLRAPRNDKKRG
jgi:hypothetical protein